MTQDIMAAVNAPSKTDGNGGLGDKNQWICEADNQNQCPHCGHEEEQNFQFEKQNIMLGACLSPTIFSRSI